jgi:hypothetical protein
MENKMFEKLKEVIEAIYLANAKDRPMIVLNGDGSVKIIPHRGGEWKDWGVGS